MRLPDTFLITDGRGDVGRVRSLVAAALAGGIRGIQLREPALAARQVADLCESLRPAVDAVAGLLVVNDRADVVAAGLAHGVQLGHRSLPAARVRRFLPASAVIGCSVHDAAEIRTAAAVADFLVLAPLFATRSKPNVVPLGAARARELCALSPVPVVLLGGIDAGNAAGARQIGASSVAVMSAVCDATEPRAAAAALAATAPDSSS